MAKSEVFHLQFTDATYLGPLCRYGHAYADTGRSLYYKAGNHCVACSQQRNNRNRGYRLKPDDAPSVPAARGIENMQKVVARNYRQYMVVAALEMYEAINAICFDGTLPLPLITAGHVPYGRCGGITKMDISAKPRIVLNESLRDPLRVFDALLHESMHVAQRYIPVDPELLTPYGRGGNSPHNDPRWCYEVNRLSPRLGFEGINAGLYKKVREGKTLVRQQIGNVPRNILAGFPASLREYLGTADAYYAANRLPLPVAFSDDIKEWLDRLWPGWSVG